jgi:hypothetical protein
MIKSVRTSLGTQEGSAKKRTWEELSILVEGHGHDTVGAVEGLLDTVTMVDVDVDVQHTSVVLEQLWTSERIGRGPC